MRFGSNSHASKEDAIDFSEVVSSLSYALDITEGQPIGHAARSCLIGMRIAREMGLASTELSALFYGLLLKDLGCSSNASKVCCLFGADDRTTKCDLKTTDWTDMNESIRFAARNAAPGGSLLRKAARIMAVATGGQKTARQLVHIRCDRGAAIARNLHLPELTAQAIFSLDEHWDGGGFPDGLAGDAIPLLSRIMGLAQTVEVFWQRDGLEAAREMATQRSGLWFDPELVRVFESLQHDSEFLAIAAATDAASKAAELEPEGFAIAADDAAMERLAQGFSQVVDAKSPWTYSHSRGVAEVSVGIGRLLGITGDKLTTLRRAALLHDIGKLGVSNLILDKPGKLTPEELLQVRKHPDYTFQILQRVKGFDQFAEMAAGHHERLDGRGYHRGLSGDQLSLEIRILAVSDMYEALAAKRPYRQDLTSQQTMSIIEQQTGTGLCQVVVDALKTFLAQSNFVPHPVAA